MRRGRRPTWAAMLLAGALVACGGPSPTATMTPSRSQSPGSGGPAGPSASQPQRDVAAIRFRLERSGAPELMPELTLYADGRLLRWQADGDRLTVRRLSRLGIEAFLAQVVASTWFEASHHVPVETLPNVSPPGMGLSFDRFTLVRDDGTQVVVSSSPYVDSRWFAASEERDDLAALAERLLEADWLDADAWSDPAPRPYAPSRFLVFSGLIEMPEVCPADSGDICSRDVDTIDWPFVLPPDGIGASFSSANGTQSVVDHCALIDPAFAAQLVGVLLPELDGAAGHLFMSASVPWRSRGAFYEFTVRPLLPEEAATCDRKSLPPVIGP